MFFGMIRQSFGGDDHPSANQFLYMYRILSVLNLTKSPKRASLCAEPPQILSGIQSAPKSRTSATATIHSCLLHKMASSQISILQNEDFTDVMFVHCSNSTEDADDIDSAMLQASETADINVYMDCAAENCPDLCGNAVSDGLLMTCNGDDISSPEQCICFYLAGYVAFKLKKVHCM
jgi:hypothetical protein